ncbi:hypothetical protein GGI00_000593 [Coemansia sp. RSA 2681]|nr:hypothetical protein GGI00_000593 [Coemansia sp. RSA 2681]
MVSVYGICLLAGAWATMLPGLAAGSSASKRDVSMSDLLGLKGAILVVNGKQTTCEAALIDSSAAFVAASCLQYKGDKLDDSAKYELAVKMGDNSAGSEVYGISKISVHSKYSSSTFINNLAVVQFNAGKPVSWSYQIGINPSEWARNYFARRSLADLGSKKWNNILALDSVNTPSDCSKYSKVYDSNKKDFICNPAETQSIYNKGCAMPYGTVYGVVQPNNINIVALHSHSVVVDGSLCSGQQKLHYYTLLRNYAAWAAKEIGRPIGGFVAAPGFTMKADYNYTMKSNTESVGGVQVFGGNRFIKDPVDPALVNQPQPPPKDTPSPTKTDTKTETKTETKATNSSKTTKSSKSKGSTTPSNTATNTSTNTEPTDTDNTLSSSDTSSETSEEDKEPAGKSGGVSGTTIAIAVVILLIVIGVGVWFYMRRKKKIKESQNGWNDRDGAESVADIPDAMRLTSEFNRKTYLASNNLPPPPVPNFGHDFGPRRTDSPVAPPPMKGGASHLNNTYRESEYVPESRPTQGRYDRPDTNYTQDNRYSEYTEAGQQGYGNGYNQGYSNRR